MYLLNFPHSLTFPLRAAQISPSLRYFPRNAPKDPISPSSVCPHTERNLCCSIFSTFRPCLFEWLLLLLDITIQRAGDVFLFMHVSPTYPLFLTHCLSTVGSRKVFCESRSKKKREDIAQSRFLTAVCLVKNTTDGHPSKSVGKRKYFQQMMLEC